MEKKKVKIIALHAASVLETFLAAPYSLYNKPNDVAIALYHFQAPKKGGKLPPFLVILSNIYRKINCLYAFAGGSCLSLVTISLIPAVNPAKPWISLGMMIFVALPSAAFAKASSAFS